MPGAILPVGGASRDGMARDSVQTTEAGGAEEDSSALPVVLGNMWCRGGWQKGALKPFPRGSGAPGDNGGCIRERKICSLHPARSMVH